MDNLITAIRRAGDNGSLVVLSLEGNEEVLNKNVSSLNQFVGRCETNFWTCVQAAVILAKLTTCSAVEPQLCSEIQTFFEAANTDHLQLSKRTGIYTITANKLPLVRRIGNLLTKKLLSQSSAIRGIPILRTAINQMQNGSKHLTSLHVNICQLAISAKFFSPVIPILNEDILDVDPNACSLPNLLLSHVTYSAAKKLILVSLIYKGEFNRTDCKVFSRIKEHLEPYRRLEIAFASQNTSSLQSLIADNQAAFEQAASEIIFVKIDHKSGCVRFLDNSERYESPEVLSTLIQKMRDTMSYDKLLRQINSEEEVRSANTENTPASSISTITTKRKSPVH
ncbi:hypothetical protein ACTXT7_011932 [Hymenolepis weldensis]